VIRETLVFPYAAGASFVQQLWRAADAPADRRAPLGDLLPQSTEQVLHPLQKFVPVRDAPTRLRLEGFGDWNRVYTNTLGAFETGILLEESLGRQEAPAWGWDGDRYALLDRADGAEALLWVSVWDDSASADTFAGRMRAVLADDSAARVGTVERFTLEGRPAVRVRITAGPVPPADVPAGDVTCVDEAGDPVSCSAA
jgi:hypothetical protein